MSVFHDTLVCIVLAVIVGVVLALSDVIQVGGLGDRPTFGMIPAQGSPVD